MGKTTGPNGCDTTHDRIALLVRYLRWFWAVVAAVVVATAFTVNSSRDVAAGQVDLGVRIDRLDELGSKPVQEMHHKQEEIAGDLSAIKADIRWIREALRREVAR